MTTFQDPQPQSRRAARQSEREESSDQPANTDDVGQSSSTGDDATITFSDAESTPESGGGATSAPRGRRAAAPAGPPNATPESIGDGDRTWSRIPTYDGPSFTDSSAAAQQQQQPTDAETPGRDAAPDDFPATQAIPQVDRPAYRVRDYSPEGRRSASPPPSWMVPPAYRGAGEPAGAADVPSAGPGSSEASPRTSVRPQFFIPESALQDTIVPSPARNTDAASDEQLPPAGPLVVEHTMTRRELRALEAQHAAESQSPPLLPEFAPDGSLTGAAAAVFVETDFGDDDDAVEKSESASAPDQAADRPALVEPNAQTGSLDEAEADDAAAVDEVALAAPTITPFDALFQVPPAAPTVAPAELAADTALPVLGSTSPEFDTLLDPVLPATAPPAADGPTQSEALAEFDFLAAESAPSARPAEPTPDEPRAAWNPPVGHWSAHDDSIDDDAGDGTVSRTIGSGIATTNALVLPSIPEGADIRGPLTGTGEIRLTGSIDLPLSLSSTGQSDRFDGDKMDALFDLSDAEVISTDSSPVRAIRAVSTHNSGHGVTHTQKPKGNGALTGLVIAASSLAVVVTGLLVAAFAFNVF